MTITEVQIQSEEAKRVMWRRIGIICGVVSLLTPVIAFSSIAGWAKNDGLAWVLFMLSIYSFLPLMIMGFVGMGLAISYRNRARRLREVSKFQ
jgi:uncharacterized membrane protein YtjA (UPF0391 family)